MEPKNPFDSEPETQSDQSNDEKDLLISDSTSFAQMQSMIWKGIKPSFISGVILFLLWFIWFAPEPTGDPKPLQIALPPPAKIEPVISLPAPENPEKKTEKTKKEVSQKTEKAPKIADSAVVKISRQAAQNNVALTQISPAGFESAFVASLQWTATLRDFFQIDPEKLISGKTSPARAKNLDSLLAQIQKWNARGLVLQQTLVAERDQFSAARQATLAQAEILKNAYFAALARMDFRNIDSILNQKIEIEKSLVQIFYELETRTQMLDQLTQYGWNLQQFDQSIRANRDAIIQNIQVVRFEFDPFGRVISPEQWRLQNQK